MSHVNITIENERGDTEEHNFEAPCDDPSTTPLLLKAIASILVTRKAELDKYINQINTLAKIIDLHPHYHSTYCIDAQRLNRPTLHEKCRKTCKNCDKPCLCDCHHIAENVAEKENNDIERTENKNNDGE